MLVAGTVIQVYGPVAVLTALWLRHYSVLQIVPFIGAFLYVLASLVTSLFYLTAGDDRSYVSMYLFLGVIFSEVFRILLCWGLATAESVFRANAQVLHSSRLRLLPLGACAGIGFGAMATLSRFVVVVDANSKLSDKGSIAYDLDACPQLPYLVFSALQANLVIAWNTAATATMLPAIAAIRSARIRHANEETSTPQVDAPLPVRDQSPPRPSSADALVRRAIPPSTNLSKIEAIVVVVIIFALSMCFSGLSLINRGAYSEVRGNQPNKSGYDAEKGCVFSLCIQLFVVLIGLAVCLGVARADAVRRS